MVSRVKPHTLNMRKSLSWQDGFGHRAMNNWGGGDLPAPYAEGDLLFLPDTASTERLHGMKPGYFVVTSGFSIDEGDAWYFRVTINKDYVSDRQHVAYANRCTWPQQDCVNWMARFTLVETSDPEGLAERERILREGWDWHPPEVCDSCGQRIK